jgi:hypothetical protein
MLDLDQASTETNYSLSNARQSTSIENRGEEIGRRQDA